MPVSRRSAAATVAAAVVLFAGSTLGSYAANGGPLLLGKGNVASKTTKLKTTGTGAALSLKSKAGKPALKISNSTKVAKFNADLVDGLDGPDLRTRVYEFDLTGAVAGNVISFPLPDLPPGLYQAGYAVQADLDGSPTFFACFFVPASGGLTQAQVTSQGADDGSAWFASGAGLLDTRTAAQKFGCQNGGGAGLTIPGSPIFGARVSLLRVDDVVSKDVAGADGLRPASGRTLGH
jgi:hypothetical protein